MLYLLACLLLFAPVHDYTWPTYYQWPDYTTTTPKTRAPSDPAVLEPPRNTTPDVDTTPVTTPIPVETPSASNPSRPKPSPPNPSIAIAKKPILDFYTAKWCGPCRMAKPILAAAEKSGKLPFTVVEIDIDDHPTAWTGQVPAFRWPCKVSPQFPTGYAALTGWYGLDHLVTEFKKSGG